MKTTRAIPLLALAFSAFAFADPSPTLKAKTDVKKPAAASEELSETEVLRYKVAHYEYAQILEAACKAHQECTKSQAAEVATVEAIDQAHHINRAAGDFFDVVARKVVRGKPAETAKAK